MAVQGVSGGVPLIDFSPLADLGKTYKDARMQAGREQSLAALGQGAPVTEVAKSLLAAGDIEGGLSLARLAESQQARTDAKVRDERDFGFRTSQAAREQGNADRSFGLQQQTANTAQIVTAEDASGNKTPIRVDREGKATAIQVPGVTDGSKTNPFSYGKMNENEAKDSGYANRMFQAEGVLRDPKLAEASQSMVDRAADRMLPADVANKLVLSEGYQKYDQAARNFINATLRRESGAAISQGEFDNAYKQYLPRPGDSAEVLAQKQRNRQDTIASIAGGGGRNYKPPFSFGQSGELIPTGNAGQGVTGAAPPPGAAAQPGASAPQAKPADADALAQAKAAIARGADRNAVIERLKKNGIEPTGI